MSAEICPFDGNVVRDNEFFFPRAPTANIKVEILCFPLHSVSGLDKDEKKEWNPAGRAASKHYS